jgi:hypothetical protein
MIRHSLDNRLTDDGEVVSLKRRRATLYPFRPLQQGKFLVLISVRGGVDPRAMARLQGLGKFKKNYWESNLRPSGL